MSTTHLPRRAPRRERRARARAARSHRAPFDYTDPAVQAGLAPAPVYDHDDFTYCEACEELFCPRCMTHAAECPCLTPFCDGDGWRIEELPSGRLVAYRDPPVRRRARAA